jgi:hypothetical protein
VAVVRNLTLVGTVDNAGMFSKDVAVNTENSDQRDLRIIAIVQERGVGRVRGVGSGRVSN